MVLPSAALPVALLVGAAVLFAGRRLFWLFVGLAGFLAGAEVAPALLPAQPAWVVLACALLAGVLGALVAVALQYWMVAAAAFAAGGYLALWLLAAWGIEPLFVLVAAGAALAALFVLLAFDWGLVFVTSLVGARVVTRALALAPEIDAPATFVLAALGIAVQAAALRRARPRAPLPAPPRR